MVRDVSVLVAVSSVVMHIIQNIRVISMPDKSEWLLAGSQAAVHAVVYQSHPYWKGE